MAIPLIVSLVSTLLLTGTVVDSASDSTCAGCWPPSTCDAGNSGNCTHHCTAGNCNMTCSSSVNHCDQFCTGGGCNSQCDAEICKLYCTSGGCNMTCPTGVKDCQLICSAGGCRFNCDAENCEQMCAGGCKTPIDPASGITCTGCQSDIDCDAQFNYQSVGFVVSGEDVT